MKSHKYLALSQKLAMKNLKLSVYQKEKKKNWNNQLSLIKCQKLARMK